MDENDLYQKQYSDKLLCTNTNSFPTLRRLLKKFDINRHDLALSLLKPGRVLLDIGCGNGTFIGRAAPYFSELHGIDLVQSQIKEAESKYLNIYGPNKKIRFHHGNIGSALPFADNTFDTTTCLAVIEHVFDPYFLIKELRRVLKKDGILIANVPNVAYIKQRLRLLFGEIPITSSPYNWDKIGWDGGHLHYFTQKTFSGLIKDCGFDVVKVTGCGFFAQFRNFYPALLTGDLCVKAIKI